MLALFSVAWLGLALAAVAWGVDHFESDIGPRVEQALSDAGYSAVTVDVEGRDVHLGGAVTSEEEPISKLLNGVDGVRTVVFEGLAAPTAPTTPASTTTTVVPTPDTPPTTLPTTLSPPPAQIVSAGSIEAGLSSIDVRGLQFLLGTPVLTAGAKAALSEMAAVLVENPGIPVEIVVRTYTETTPGQNHGLSTQQAAAVVAHLVANGVEEQRLSAVGLGSPPGPPPTRNGILLFEATDTILGSTLRSVDTVAIDLTPGGITVEGLAALDEVAAELALVPDVPLTLVAYAYDGGSASANHDRSHFLADTAVAHLVAGGVDPSRLATVGLGEIPVNLDFDTVTTYEVGPRAALAIALSQIDNASVDFEQHTGTLTQNAHGTLDQVTAVMELDQDLGVEIAAHAYSEATSEANHGISHQQGDSVVSYLVNAGIDPARLRLVGHGDPPHFFQPGRDSFITFTVIR